MERGLPPISQATGMCSQVWEPLDSTTSKALQLFLALQSENWFLGALPPVWSDLGKSGMKEKPLERLPEAAGGSGWGLQRRGRHRLTPPQPCSCGHFLHGLRHGSMSHRGLTHTAQEVWGREDLLFVVS